MCLNVIGDNRLDCSTLMRDKSYAMWCKPCLIGEIKGFERALEAATVREIVAKNNAVDSCPELDPEEWAEVCGVLRGGETQTPVTLEV